MTLVAPDGLRKVVSGFVRLLARKGVLARLLKKGLSKPADKKFTSRLMDLPVEKLTDEMLLQWRKPYRDPNLSFIITKSNADDDIGKISLVGLKMSVQLIYQTQDGLVPKMVYASYEALLKNPRIEVYEGSRHFIIMEEHPEQLATSLRVFLDRIQRVGQRTTIKVAPNEKTPIKKPG